MVKKTRRKRKVKDKVTPIICGRKTINDIQNKQKERKKESEGKDRKRRKSIYLHFDKLFIQFGWIHFVQIGQNSNTMWKWMFFVAIASSIDKKCIQTMR